MTPASRICRLVASLLFSAAALAAVEPTNYAIKRIHFHNHGEYTMKAFVRYNRAGVKCMAQPFSDTGFGRGASKTANLTNSKGWKRVQGGSACKLPIAKGEEVWGKIEIDAGENKSCRKDGSKMFYDPDGGPVTYVVAGTTFNNNRCRIDAITDELWSEGSE